MTEAQDQLIGTLVSGRYRVIKPLGHGGMGQVYLAEHEAIQKLVALKVLKLELSLKPDIVSRFRQEAISASRIKHPNVLDVFDFGQLDNGCFFLAMEYLEGKDLAEELTAYIVLEPTRGTQIGIDICRALAAAHAQGVVHRDLKPENIFLQRTGDGDLHTKIVDFGIAQLRSTEEAAATETARRLTKTGMIFGTPEYMAPEQAMGKEVDLRSDIYAVGVILYEMFTGAVPFAGDTFFGVLTKHMSEDVPPMRLHNPELKISAQLEDVIARALAKDPARRQQSMRQLAAELLNTPEGRQLGGRVKQTGIPEVVQSQLRSAPPPPSSPEAQPIPLANRRGSRPRNDVPAPESGSTAQTAILTPTPRKRSTWPFVALILVAVAGAGVGIWLKQSEAQANATAAPPPEPAAPELTEATEAEPQPMETEDAAAEEPPRVTISVESVPSGAIIHKDGFQVCDSTPCEVMALANSSLKLTADKGRMHGQAKVLAQSDQKVTIMLRAPSRPSSKPEPSPAATERSPKPQNQMCEVEVDGLKILRPCD